MARLMQTSAKWPFIAFVILETLIFGSGNAIAKMPNTTSGHLYRGVA